MQAQKEKAEKEAKLKAQMSVRPEEMFLGMNDQYSRYDECGIPTHDMEGKELSKSKQKQLRREYEKQQRLYDQYQKG